MNLMEVAIEKNADDNPTCIVWPDGRRFAISSSGAPLAVSVADSGQVRICPRRLCDRSRQQDPPQVAYRGRR